MMKDHGYRLVPDTQSRAVSLICFDDLIPQETESEEPEIIEEKESDDDKVSQEELVALSLQHAQEIQKLQEEFG